MAGLGFQELLIIFLIIALLFGAKKIPELARGLGQAMKEFKKASREGGDEKETEKSEGSVVMKAEKPTEEKREGGDESKVSSGGGESLTVSSTQAKEKGG